MNNRVLISADCVCDIPVEMAEELNVSLMYYYIITEEGRFRDMTEIRTEQVLEYMEVDRKKAHSAAAKTEDYREYFAGLRKKTEKPIIHLCMSKKLSRGCGRAEEAAKSFKDIYVVDSKNISGGMGHLVFQAAEMANAGACVEMILAMLEGNRRKVQTTVLLDSTECVFRSGNLEKTQHLFCETLNLHPMVRLRAGRLTFFGLCFGNPYRYAKKYLRRILKRPEEINTEFALLMYTSCPEELIREIEAEMRRLVDFRRILVVPTYATVSCDIGSGCFGVVYIKK